MKNSFRFKTCSVPATPITALQIERLAMTSTGGSCNCHHVHQALQRAGRTSWYFPTSQHAAQCQSGMLYVPHFSPHQSYNADLLDSLFATFAVSAPFAHSQAYQQMSSSFRTFPSLSANATAFYVEWKANYVVLVFFNGVATWYCTDFKFLFHESLYSLTLRHAALTFRHRASSI